MFRPLRRHWNTVENTIERVYDWSTGWQTEIDDPIDLTEISALIRYASENGIDPPGPDPKKPEKTTLKLLNDAMQKYQDQTKHPSNETPNLHDDAEGEYEDIKSIILYHYARLTRHTRIKNHQIHGRTLIDTRNSGRATFPLMAMIVLLMGLAITNEIVVSWSGDQVFPTDEDAIDLHFYKEHVLQHLMPFVWGALGGCIYLAMRLYNIARHRAFDRSKYHGWVLRVLLASIIGAVTFYIIKPTELTTGGAPIEAKTLAFLAGLGVKVVYGGFEKLVDTLVEKFNLDALRSAPSDRDHLLKQYALQLTDPDVADNPKKRDAVIQLIKSLEREAV